VYTSTFSAHPAEFGVWAAACGSQGPEKLDKLVELQFAVTVLVVLHDERLDLVVGQTEAVQRRPHLGQRHRATLVAVQLVEHLTNALDSAHAKTTHRVYSNRRGRTRDFTMEGVHRLTGKIGNFPKGAEPEGKRDGSLPLGSKGKAPI